MQYGKVVRYLSSTCGCADAQLKNCAAGIDVVPNTYVRVISYVHGRVDGLLEARDTWRRSSTRTKGFLCRLHRKTEDGRVLFIICLVERRRLWIATYAQTRLSCTSVCWSAKLMFDPRSSFHFYFLDPRRKMADGRCREDVNQNMHDSLPCVSLSHTRYI